MLQASRVKLTQMNAPTTARCKALSPSLFINSKFFNFNNNLLSFSFILHLDLRTAFDLLDRDQDGMVTPTELQFMLRNLGIEMSDELIDGLMKEASKTGKFRPNFLAAVEKFPIGISCWPKTSLLGDFKVKKKFYVSQCHNGSFCHVCKALPRLFNVPSLHIST